MDMLRLRLSFSLNALVKSTANAGLAGSTGGVRGMF